jgi:GT2 family glycosyltransferase/glycosyltransferase involved in cell wall biosynthesis
VLTRVSSAPPRGRALASAIGYRLASLRSVLRRVFASLRANGLRVTLGKIRWKIRHHLWPEADPPIDLVLPGPDEHITAADIAFDAVDAPRASIVVPVHNGLALTLACLHSLARHRGPASFEVIAVDDASSDATVDELPRIRGLRVVRLDTNVGFIAACNAGAAQARGEFLVLLNNDTYVQPGWLDALLETFANHPDTGLAGSKLVYPDGRLQEAGGIVFADGSAWNYGRNGQAGDPRHNFVRAADYCSGAAIALPRALFDELGGFDKLYTPAYYEDTDLAMRVRERGLQVRYQPASVVVHHEGATSGTDINTGIKAYQVANHAKFLERWRDTLAAKHPPPGTPIARACDHRKRHRVLVLDACTPTPDRDSGSVRMFALMRLLLDLDCSVAFINEVQGHDGPYTRALQQLGVEAWWYPWSRGLPDWLAQHGGEFDLVIGSRHYVLGPLLDLLRLHAPQAQVVFDTVDLHFLRDERAAEMAGDATAMAAAQRTREAELHLVDGADATWVVSPVERALLLQLRPDATVEVVSNIHDVDAVTAGPEGRAGLLFVGGFRHTPNVDAVRWLVQQILPRVRARRPDVELHVAGADLPPELRALGGDGVHWHGHVADLGPLLRECRLSVAPLRFGAGVKGKINQALAAGLPVVATTCAVEGMGLVDGVDALVADDADAFADAIVRGYGDDDLWRRLAAGGLENTRRHFSPDVARQALAARLATLPRR